MRVRELTIRYTPHSSGATIDGRQCLDPRTCAAILTPMLEHQAQEVFVIILLNTKHRIIAVHEVSKGGMNTAQVDPRIIFRAALLANAPAIILAHNHPSGDPTPSPDDLNLTQRLMAAGALLGIEVLDHIIIGDRQYCSLKETGRL